MDYAALSKETVSFLYQSYASLKKSPLDSQLRILAELRTSQINGCAYCCKLHTNDARKAGISQDKLDELVSWRTSTLFTELYPSEMKMRNSSVHFCTRWAFPHFPIACAITQIGKTHLAQNCLLEIPHLQVQWV